MGAEQDPVKLDLDEPGGTPVSASSTRGLRQSPYWWMLSTSALGILRRTCAHCRQRWRLPAGRLKGDRLFEQVLVVLVEELLRFRLEARDDFLERADPVFVVKAASGGRAFSVRGARCQCSR